MKKLLFFFYSLIVSFTLNAQSTVDSYTWTTRFFNNDFLQMYQGARLSAPTMTLPNSISTYTSTLPFVNTDNLQLYNAIRGLGDATSSFTNTSWNITGNAINTNTNFIGTTTNRSINFKTNDSLRFKIDSLGVMTWTAPSSGYYNNFVVKRWESFPDIPAIYFGSQLTPTNYFALADGYNSIVNSPTVFIVRAGNQTRYSAASTDALITGGTFNTFSGTNTASLNATRQLTNLQVAGFNVGYQAGITPLTANLLVNAITHSANTTATITECNGIRVIEPITGTGMTITRKWALKAEGSACITNSLILGSSTGTAAANLHVAGTGTASGTFTFNGIQNTNYTGSGTITNPNYQAGYIYNYYTGATNMSISTRPSSSQDIIFLSNGTTPTETMRLNSSGNMSVTGTTILNGLQLASGSVSITSKGIDTTPGDAATINSPTGRFRKDTSGNTFVLTNNLITANSIIILTIVTTGVTTGYDLAVTANAGSATITFQTAGSGAAPNTDCDVNFWVIN